MKRCRKCGQTKPLGDFHRRKDTASGTRAHCKACVRSENRSRNASYAQLAVTVDQKRCTVCKEIRPSSRFAKTTKNRTDGLRSECLDCHCKSQIPRESKRRATKAGCDGRHSPSDRAARFAFYGNKCVVCGSADRLEADHNIPLSRGGADWASNIIPLCKRCNISKHTKTLREFLVSRPVVPGEPHRSTT